MFAIKKSTPREYSDGELIVEETVWTQSIKLAVGNARPVNVSASAHRKASCNAALKRTSCHHNLLRMWVDG